MYMMYDVYSTNQNGLNLQMFPLDHIISKFNFLLLGFTIVTQATHRLQVRIKAIFLEHSTFK